MKSYSTYIISGEDKMYDIKNPRIVYLKLKPGNSGYEVSTVEHPRDATHFKSFEEVKSHLFFIIDLLQGGKAAKELGINYYDASSKNEVKDLPRYLEVTEVHSFYPATDEDIVYYD